MSSPRSHSWSLRKVHAAKQLDKARIGMQRLQGRVDFQKGHQGSPVLKVSFKRDHGLFFFSEPRIDLRYVELSDIRRISFVPFLNFLPESLGSLCGELFPEGDLIGSDLGVIVPSKESSLGEPDIARVGSTAKQDGMV
jgi:hypothetical protein